ncbi:MAG: hypothetical protein AB7U05_03705 [Mangrovibacterium sp.]
MNPQTNQPTVKSIRFVYSALIIGFILFLSIGIFLIKNTGAFGEFDGQTSTIMLITAAVLSLSAIPAGISIARKKFESIEKLPVNEKLIKFQSSMIIRAATQEGSGYLFVVLFLLTGSNIFLVGVAIVIGLLVYFSPTNIRMAEEMKHNLRELDKL